MLFQGIKDLIEHKIGLNQDDYQIQLKELEIAHLKSCADFENVQMRMTETFHALNTWRDLQCMADEGRIAELFADEDFISAMIDHVEQEQMND